MSRPDDNSINDRAYKHLLDATRPIYEHIKLADQKALVFVALNGGLIGTLYRTPILTSPDELLRAATTVALILLVTGTGLALLTIKPRRGQHARERGVLDPGSITRFRNAEDFLMRLQSMSLEELNKDSSGRIWDLCKIDAIKYRWLNVSIIVSSLGWAVALLAAWMFLNSSTTQLPLILPS